MCKRTNATHCAHVAKLFNDSLKISRSMVRILPLIFWKIKNVKKAGCASVALLLNEHFTQNHKMKGTGTGTGRDRRLGKN